MKLIATKDMRYGTRRLVAGDTFEAKDAHAKVLVAIKRARKAPGPGRPRKADAPKEAEAQMAEKPKSAPFKYNPFP